MPIIIIPMRAGMTIFVNNGFTVKAGMQRNPGNLNPESNPMHMPTIADVKVTMARAPSYWSNEYAMRDY